MPLMVVRCRFAELESQGEVCKLATHCSFSGAEVVMVMATSHKTLPPVQRKLRTTMEWKLCRVY